MKEIITWQEYCYALNLDYDEQLTPEQQEPKWFRRTQRMAIKILKKCLAQSHLVPTSRLMLGNLKPRFLDDVIEGISEQIRFINENNITFDNGWLNADNSFGVGQYNQGPMTKFNIEKTFSALCPQAFDIFDDLGWTYASLSNKIPTRDFYNHQFDVEDELYKEE